MHTTKSLLILAWVLKVTTAIAETAPLQKWKEKDMGSFSRYYLRLTEMVFMALKAHEHENFDEKHITLNMIQPSANDDVYLPSIYLRTVNTKGMRGGFGFRKHDEIISLNENEDTMPMPSPPFPLPTKSIHGILNSITLKNLGSTPRLDTNVLLLQDSDEPVNFRALMLPSHGSIAVSDAIAVHAGIQKAEASVSTNSFTFSVEFLVFLASVLSVSFFGMHMLSINKENIAEISIKSAKEFECYLENAIKDVERLAASSQFAMSRTLIKTAIQISYNTKFSCRHDPGTLYHLLASVEIKAGNNKAALNAMYNAYEIYENSLGASAPTIRLLEDMGSLLAAMNQNDEADNVIDRAHLYKQQLENANVMVQAELITYKESLISRAADRSTSEDEIDIDAEIDMINKTVQGVVMVTASPGNVMGDMLCAEAKSRSLFSLDVAGDRTQLFSALRLGDKNETLDGLCIGDGEKHSFQLVPSSLHLQHAFTAIRSDEPMATREIVQFEFNAKHSNSAVNEHDIFSPNKDRISPDCVTNSDFL